MEYPPLIRRELLTNVLSQPGQAPDLLRYIEQRVVADLGDEIAVELELLKAVKTHRLSIDDIEQRHRFRPRALIPTEQKNLRGAAKGAWLRLSARPRRWP